MTGTIIKRVVTLTTLGLIIAFSINHKSSANSQNSEAQDPQAIWAAVVKNINQSQGQPAASTEKPAEQEYKNIQALKGMPAWQLEQVMHLFNGSLGVRCDFCHVRTGDKWEWDKDDKQAKKVARKMIQMTLDINKTSFNNRPEVSCYTCHQGHEHPANPPALPVAVVAVQPPAARPAPNAQPTPGTQPTPGATPAGMPTPDQILQKYVEAVGGKAAIEKVQSRQMKGTYTRQGGQPLPYEVLQTPGKLLLTVTTPQGTNVRGFNGTTGWSQQGNQTHEMEKGELTMMKDWLDAFDALKIKEPYPRFAFRGKDKIGANEVYVLTGATPDRRRLRLYFDIKTGLLLRKQILANTPVGTDPTQIDFADYKKVDGVMLPMTISVYYAEFAFSGARQFKEIKQNVPVADTKFEMPKP
ncbi:MAG: c-type cytochrome [Acidobacteriota bacterium]